MSLLDRIADRLLQRAKRTPYEHIDGYMNRWWLVPYAQELHAADGTGPVTWRRPIAKLIQKMGFAVRVHEILRGDETRHPHDHPWPYLAVILKGGYWERRYDADGSEIDAQWYGPGAVLWRPAGSWHLLALYDPAVTLFITGKYVGTWGFNVNGEKIPHYDYEEYL